MSEQKSAAGTVTVVTGPPGVDIGPVVARLGDGLGDGLAIRTVVSDAPEEPHTSPDPYHRHNLGSVDCTGTGTDACTTNVVKLSVLPSAWQDPDTNLGVAYTDMPDTVGLCEDLARFDALGLHPGHRVTVQYPVSYRAEAAIPAPIEVGDLAAQARDSVLRTGGRVLVEAGDGQTAQNALHAVGLAPWAPCIGRLDIWIVLDAQLALDRTAGLNEAVTHAREHLLNIAAAEVRANGGPPPVADDIGAVNIWLALLNVHRLPGLATIEGLDAIVTGTDNETLPTVDQTASRAMGDLLDACNGSAGAFPALLGTGDSTFIDLLGDHGVTPAS